MEDPTVIAGQIRFALEQMSQRNAQHDFEHLCRHLVKARICSNVLPATGPVQSGGDQGRDFETFQTHLDANGVGDGRFLGLVNQQPIVFACTLNKQTQTKAKDDITTIVAFGAPVERIYFFCVADVAVAVRHDLQNFARSNCDVRLEVFDGAAISELLSQSDTFWIAKRYLHLPEALLPAAEVDTPAVHDVLPAPESSAVEAALVQYREQVVREWAFVPYRGIAGLGHTERVVQLPLEDIYVPPQLQLERDHIQLNDREREVLAQLSDPDLNSAQQARLEERYAELAAARWTSSASTNFGAGDEDAEVTWSDHLQILTAEVAEEVAEADAVFESIQAAALNPILQSSQPCVVLGAPGSGKSTLARFLAHQCASGVHLPTASASATRHSQTSDSAVENDIRASAQQLQLAASSMPILVSLASYATWREQLPKLNRPTSSRGRLVEFIEEFLETRGGPPLVAAFRREWAAGKCWLILDGLDEIVSYRMRQDAVREIESLWPIFSGNRCLITSRPYGYIPVAGQVTHLHLGPFDRRRIMLFLGMWHVALENWLHPDDPDEVSAVASANALIEQIRSDSNISQLAGNPLMLVIMALIYREKKQLPQKRIELYEAIVTTLLDTWNQWRSQSSGMAKGTTLPLHELRQVLGKVALWARAEKNTGLLPRVQLHRQIVRALQELELEGTDAESTADSYLNAIVEQAGLLEERMSNIFAFWHPTIEEFLAACELTTPSTRAASRLLPLRHDPRWREVILLSVARIGVLNADTETATDLVSALADDAPDFTEPLLHRHLRLALECLCDDPGVKRSFAQSLLARAARVVAKQPYTPLDNTLRRTIAALPRLVPNPELVDAFSEMMKVEEARSQVGPVALLLLSNVTSCSTKARQLSRRHLNDPEEDVRRTAAIGLARAGEFSAQVLAAMVWGKNSLQSAAISARILGLHNTEDAHSREILRQLRLFLQNNTQGQHSPSCSEQIAACLLQVGADDNESRSTQALADALEKCWRSHPEDEAVFEAAYGLLLLKQTNWKQLRLAAVVLRENLSASSPARRLEAVKCIFTSNRALDLEILPPDGSRSPELDLLEPKFRALDDWDIHSECVKALESCLDAPTWQIHLDAAHRLLASDIRHCETVAKAMESWVTNPEFPRLAYRPVAEAIYSCDEKGYQIIYDWLVSEDDWLRIHATGLLKRDETKGAEVTLASVQCLGSPFDEIRSTMGAVMAFFYFHTNTPLPEEVEQALRSCFGSEQSDASQNAASALFHTGHRDVEVIQHLLPYLWSQDLRERLSTIKAIQVAEKDEAVLKGVGLVLGVSEEQMRRLNRQVQRGTSLTAASRNLLLRLISVKPEDTGYERSTRHVVFDWLWWNYEVRHEVRSA